MKHWILPLLILLALCVPAVAQDGPQKVDVGLGFSADKGTADFLSGLLKVVIGAAGGGFGLEFFKKWKDGKKPVPTPTPVPVPAPDGGFDPANLIDRLKDLLNGKEDSPVSPIQLPIAVPTDLQRFLDFVSQTKALHEDIKTKGQPVGSKHEFDFADGSSRVITIGSKSVPAPVAV